MFSLSSLSHHLKIPLRLQTLAKIARCDATFSFRASISVCFSRGCRCTCSSVSDTGRYLLPLLLLCCKSGACWPTSCSWLNEFLNPFLISSPALLWLLLLPQLISPLCQLSNAPVSPTPEQEWPHQLVSDTFVPLPDTHFQLMTLPTLRELDHCFMVLTAQRCSSSVRFNQTRLLGFELLRRNAFVYLAPCLL